ncbi:unnamed protein product [Ectocarpus sp. 13 AM-2016]
MYAFPDIPRDKTRRVAHASTVFRDVLSAGGSIATQDNVSREKGPEEGEPTVLDEGENPSGLVPDVQSAKFFALGAQFVIIQNLCNQDLRFKKFYDLVGSGGKAGLAALLLERWSSIVSLESSKRNYDGAIMARRAMGHVESPGALTKTPAWTIEHTTVTKADWVDGDVVFLDGTVFECLDEGVLFSRFQERLGALQAGSFVVVFTFSSEQLLSEDFKLIYSNTHRYTTADGRAGGSFTSWLFKTLMHSNDHRVGMPDFKPDGNRNGCSECNLQGRQGSYSV